MHAQLRRGSSGVLFLGQQLGFVGLGGVGVEDLPDSPAQDPQGLGVELARVADQGLLHQGLGLGRALVVRQLVDGVGDGVGLLQMQPTGSQRDPGGLTVIERLGLTHSGVGLGAGEGGGVGQPVRRTGPTGLRGDVAAVGLTQHPPSKLRDLRFEPRQSQGALGDFVVAHRPRRLLDDRTHRRLELGHSRHDGVSPIEGAGVFGHAPTQAPTTDTDGPESGLSTHGRVTRE